MKTRVENWLNTTQFRVKDEPIDAHGKVLWWFLTG